MSRLAQIETFALIVEQGSLAAAARILDISGVAVSKQLSRLEADLGIQLLKRSTRYIELTEMGASYYEQCQRVIEEVKVADSLVAHMQAEPQGELKVVSGRHFGLTYIVPYLQEFLQLYPNIHLSLELAERIPNLEVEALDISIGTSVPASSNNVVQRCVATTRYALCASPEYLRQFGHPKKPTDLQHHRYITHSMRQPNDVIAFAQQQIVRLNPYLRINDAETMRHLAEQGMGIAKLHYYVVQDALQKGKLKEVLSSYMQGEIPLYVAYLQRRYIPAKMRCFIDFVIAKIKA
jgi:DNA-binding transcriptional LysR family regulator